LLPVLALVPANGRQAAALAALSWGVVIARNTWPQPIETQAELMTWLGWLSTWCIMLPATVMVLRRPNEGPALWRSEARA
jgi:hypothetical protein